MLIDKISKLTANSSFYQGKSYVNAKSFQDFPIITKEDIIQNYKEIFCKVEPLLFVQTSGSTGCPIKIAWNYNDYLKSLATLWRLRATNGILPTDFQLTCHAEIDIQGRKIKNPINVFPNALSLSKLCYSSEILQEYTRYIEIFHPKWIYAQPSFVYFIGMHISQHKPQLLGEFKYIELVGELLTLETKKQIQEMFPNANVVNMYGTQEFNGIMYEENGSMKVIDDNVYVEILDEFGNKCNLGEEGDIVVTGLHNSAFPLVRYNTKDRGKLVSINGVQRYIITTGRANDSLQLNEKTYDGSVFFTIVNDYNRCHNPKIQKFQVIYDEEGFRFFVWSEAELPNKVDMAIDLRNIMIDRISTSAPVIVEVTSSPDSFIKGGNKVKYFINSKAMRQN